jgi:hypothetical protein
MKPGGAIERVVKVLLEAGEAGIIRSELRLRADIPTAVLSDVLRFLDSRNELREEEERRRDEAATVLRGRPATRYFYTPGTKPLPEELPLVFSTPKVMEPSSAPSPIGMVTAAACVWCKKPLPVQLAGRPREFCTRDCWQASTLAAKVQLLTILQRPKDPFVLNTTARLIAAADLVSRGWRVCGIEGLGHLLVQRNGQVLCVGVYIADEYGQHFEGEDGADVRVVVRRDGAIRYTGIVFDEEPQKTEPPGVDETTGGEEQRVR